ncbi:GNAT family N-acetyltransferase [Anaeromyxobacter paludicola]|uniref:N-acetyltransferase n=1 Tax=Anaeromyxobacter paludicola TaxID=2918171 RepID=A0ABM7XEB4_9BACT|nr:GNAT family protein [Anaeromyxobacter paludicola]BDG10243.1 N-acetyltransferase [Anaeromyxobacter paludicola]
MTGAPLEGARVRLRPLVRADAPALAGFVNEPSVRRTALLAGPVSVRDEEEFVLRVRASTVDAVFGIETLDERRLVGVTGLHAIDRTSRAAQFGIFIGLPALWNRGLGTDATRVVVRHGFEALQLHRIWLHVFSENLAGVRCYEKVGFVREGLLREAVFHEGRHHDLVTMALLRRDWPGAGA